MDITFSFFLIFFLLKVVNNAHWERDTDKAFTNKTNIQKPSFWKWRPRQHLLFKAQAWSNSGMVYYTTSLPYVNANIFTTVYNIIHFWGLSFEGNQCVSSSTQALACSRRSDSGEWCKVKKGMNSRGGTLPLPCFYFFAVLFTSHCSPLSERLEQATQEIPYHFFVVCACCEVSKWYSLKGKNLLRGVKFWTAAQPDPRNPRCRPLNKVKFPLNIIN